MLKKIKDYIKENNNKLNTIIHKLDYTENERDNLLLDRNQLYGKLKGTEIELFETKEKLDEAEDDTNEKTKYIDKLKGIQEKYDYQINKIKELESELNAKNETIKNLENEKNEISKKLAKEVKELKDNLIENKKYFDYYEENKIITKEHINELNKMINKLNNENDKILKTLNEEFKENKLKDIKLNEYLEGKKNNGTKITR